MAGAEAVDIRVADATHRETGPGAREDPAALGTAEATGGSWAVAGPEAGREP